jgi:hypothetical protein
VLFADALVDAVAVGTRRRELEEPSEISSRDFVSVISRFSTSERKNAQSR